MCQDSDQSPPPGPQTVWTTSETKKRLQQKTKLKNVKSEKPGKTIQTKWSYTI